MNRRDRTIGHLLVCVPLGVLLWGVVLSCLGCAGPRVVFVPAAEAPVRAGPGMTGKVYVWTGQIWELSSNRVSVPEGYYIWDSGEPAPTNTVKGK
ncbi:MAG: hypothetical protein WCR06_04810 [bacterium]